MVIDTSAMICILLDEPEATQFVTTMLEAPALKMAAPIWQESAMIISTRKGSIGFEAFAALVSKLAIEIVPFDAAMAAVAFAGWQSYGKGRHPAALNICDCFSYALAKCTGDSLLFKGNDFTLTDVVPAR